MIYTSYFSNQKKFPKEFRLICIARYAPPNFPCDFKLELAPTHELLRGYKTGSISQAGYTIQFKKQLEQLDPLKIAEEAANSILLCYEGKGKFCHRHLVSEWLKGVNVQIEEL